MTKRVLVFILILSLSLPLLAAGPAETDRAKRERIEQLMIQAAANAGKSVIARVSFEREAAIEVLSFSWGVSNSATAPGSGGGAGKANFNDFAFSKKVDKSSPVLMQACATGKHFKDVVVEILNDKGATLGRISFSDVMVSSYETGGAGGEIPIESVSFNYSTITPPSYEILIGL